MNEAIYRAKVAGAWVGKAVGGSLGQPWEGCRGPLALTFYDPVPKGVVPNDDLDLQVLWAAQLAGEWDGEVDRMRFAEAWQECVGFPCDEYGVAIRNLRIGIPPPWSGRYDNWFVDGMGAAIRSELWACLAPDDPARAARLAEEDACVDHDGDGLHAIRFLAALESMAFGVEGCGEGALAGLIGRALEFIPAGSILARAIRDTRDWCAEGVDDLFTRMDERYGSENFTDVKINLAYITAALLTGGGDFGRTVCAAANFGRDADCTAATVGAILGIVDPDGIPEAWRAPIGDEIVLSPGIIAPGAPGTLTELTDLVVDLRGRARLAGEGLVREPDWRRYAIACRRSVFSPWFADDYRKFSPRPGTRAEEVTLPGNLTTIDFSDLPRNALLMLEMDFVLPARREVRLLVNTPANLRVWVDDAYCFGREGGSMTPAFHRAPLNQSADLVLEAGPHRLTLGLAPVHEAMRRAELLFGLADRENHWLPFAFRPGLGEAGPLKKETAGGCRRRA